MINKSNTNERPEFIAGAGSADAFQREFIQVPMAAARQPAINIGLDLLAFMSALPLAFLASEERELKRLARTSDDKNDPRIERLKLSIERAGVLNSTAQQGKGRIDRAIVAMSTQDNVFHGFISDVNLKPQEKLTVRISASRDGNTDGDKDTKSLSTTTDADGYFSISLGKEKTHTRKSGTNENTVKLSEQMAERLASVNAKTKTDGPTASNQRSEAAGSANTNEVLARVEILDANKNIIYQDPSPLVVNTGTAYREYVIDGNHSGSSYSSNVPAATASTPETKKKTATAAVTKTTTAAKKTPPGKIKNE